MRDQLDGNQVQFFGEPLELRFASGKAENEISGYGSIFGNTDLKNSVIMVGAFADSLAKHRALGTKPAMLWQHDPREPIGVWERVEEDPRGLKVSGWLNLDTARGREAMSLVKQGALDGLSIGSNIVEADRDRTGLNTITKLDLWEISLVTFPANPLARLRTQRSAPQFEKRSDLEAFLREVGFPKAAARAVTAAGWAGLSKSNSTEAELLAEIRAFNSKLKEI
jgi:HK97 family phage prohead protease